MLTSNRWVASLFSSLALRLRVVCWQVSLHEVVMPFGYVLVQDAVECGTSADGYYDEAKGRSDNTGRKPISALDAHRCWTSAMRTS
jgi:hypothetical protein